MYEILTGEGGSSRAHSSRPGAAFPTWSITSHANVLRPNSILSVEALTPLSVSAQVELLAWGLSTWSPAGKSSAVPCWSSSSSSSAASATGPATEDCKKTCQAKKWQDTFSVGDCVTCLHVYPPVRCSPDLITWPAETELRCICRSGSQVMRGPVFGPLSPLKHTADRKPTSVFLSSLLKPCQISPNRGLRMLAPGCNPNIQEAEAGGLLWV